MRKHHYVIADKFRFAVFCGTLLVCCSIAAYAAGAIAGAQDTFQMHSTGNSYYHPMHFANQHR